MVTAFVVAAGQAYSISIATAGAASDPCQRPLTPGATHGPDNLTGTQGAEVIVAGGGNDTIQALGGNDTLCGGEGNDVLNGGPGADRVRGQGGIDTATYAPRTNAVFVDLDDVADDGEIGESDNVATGVENLTGGSGADHLTGSAVSNTLTGSRGADVLRGLGGADRLLAADGAPDTEIDCGAGTQDTAYLDRTGDPSPVGCENLDGGGGAVAFEKVGLPTAVGKPFTSLAIGPDGKLYATTLEGEILRFPLNADGTTGTAEVISSLQVANGGSQRMAIGLGFDPSSTAANLVLWVTHSAFAFEDAPDWTGKISRLSGPNLGSVQDYVVGLPRSTINHLTNSLAFGPDGALYVLQGSNTAMGAPDSVWGMRPERQLNAAVLRVDPGEIVSPPLDVKTAEGGTYDAFSPLAPLKIYASGVRNAYDLVWHTNGQLYVPTNGSTDGGNTPGTPDPLPASCAKRIDVAAKGPYSGPQVPALTNVRAQSDFLFRVVQNGYYGHPNPERCEWVLNGGNPSAAVDRAEVQEYPVGTQPDRNWRGAAFNFGLHKSPNGVIEYRSNAFGGLLEGRLLVIRYSQGDDIVVLTPGGPSFNVVGSHTGIAGLTGFTNPLDLVENKANGYLYVAEYGAERITLLRPVGG